MTFAHAIKYVELYFNLFWINLFKIIFFYSRLRIEKLNSELNQENNNNNENFKKSYGFDELRNLNLHNKYDIYDNNKPFKGLNLNEYRPYNKPQLIMSAPKDFPQFNPNQTQNLNPNSNNNININSNVNASNPNNDNLIPNPIEQSINACKENSKSSLTNKPKSIPHEDIDKPKDDFINVSVSAVKNIKFLFYILFSVVSKFLLFIFLKNMHSVIQKR